MRVGARRRGAMVGGFNTNVRYRGRLFHVQTEDGGPGNPYIVTLLYDGGAIRHSRKQGYQQEIGAADLELRVRARMDQQHREVVNGLRSGAHDALLGFVPAGPAPELRAPEFREQEFGAGVLTDVSLDELILRHLIPA